MNRNSGVLVIGVALATVLTLAGAVGGQGAPGVPATVPGADVTQDVAVLLVAFMVFWVAAVAALMVTDTQPDHRY